MDFTDDFDLTRFVTAQVRKYSTALAKMRQGAKKTHWIWYIFPQIVGLAQSSNGTGYGIITLEESTSLPQTSSIGRTPC